MVFSSSRPRRLPEWRHEQHLHAPIPCNPSVLSCKAAIPVVNEGQSDIHNEQGISVYIEYRVRGTLHISGQVSRATHLKMFRLGDPHGFYGRLMHVDFFGSGALKHITSLLDFIGSPVCDQQELASFERSLVLHHAVLRDTEAE